MRLRTVLWILLVVLVVALVIAGLIEWHHITYLTAKYD